MADATSAEKASEFDDTPEGWQRRWEMEFSAAEKRLEKFHTQGEKVVDYYLDERGTEENSMARLGLFTADIDTMKSMLYGRIPQVDVDRRNNDANDDVARVAAVALERLLNNDIERDADSYASTIELAVEDRLLPGLGCGRVRYVAKFETQDVPPIHAKDEMGQPVLGEDGQPVVMAEGYQKDVKTYECVEVDYIHWKDTLWGAGRTWHEVPWWSHKAEMTRDELVKRFGEDKAKDVPLNSKRAGKSDREQVADPWDRADVWEIWHKESKKVFWFVKGHSAILDTKDDTLKLKGFFPCPKPMASHVTTRSYVPKADFVLHQDLYKKADVLFDRITVLEDAIGVKGLYDKTNEEIQDLLKAKGNVMIPVDRWAAFAEKNGVKGQVDWMPLDQVVGAIMQLTQKLNDTINMLRQATGMSDIMRGQAMGAATATEQAIKAKFASVRVQAAQDEVARFATDLQKLKAEIIGNHFDVETIVRESNILQTADGKDMQLVQQAAQLLKDSNSDFRVQVKSDAISLTDYAALKQEKSEVLTTLGGFFQSMAPVIQGGLVPADTAMELAQWTVAGLKGASTMEGILDSAIQQSKQAAQQKAMQPPPPPPPDPKLQTEQFKAQAEAQQSQLEHGQNMQRIQAETQAAAQLHQVQALTNVRELEASERIKAMHDVKNLALGPAQPGVPFP